VATGFSSRKQSLPLFSLLIFANIICYYVSFPGFVLADGEELIENSTVDENNDRVCDT